MPQSLATPSRVPLFLSLLVALHIAIVIASNYLVQLPITLLGFHSTWGAFSFPFIFLATDLTVRLIGKTAARRVITRAMLPALLASYVVGVLFHEGHFNGWQALGEFNTFVFRIAFASFAAYVLGQLLDIQVFDRIRQQQSGSGRRVLFQAVVAFGNFDVKAVFEGRSRSLEGADQHVDAQRHVGGLEDRNLFRSGFNLCLIIVRKSRRRDDNRSLCFKRVSENLRESGEM